MRSARDRTALPASTSADLAILVFARAPLPGRAKTRLAPRLGDWGAARLHGRMIHRTLRTARAAGCGIVELHVAGRRRNGFFRLCEAKFGVAVKSQAGSDLGERMHNAIAAALRRHRAVILVGTDCPALAPRDLRRAARWLRGGCSAVLAPAEDGGYALIGLRKASNRLFDGMEWGGDDVFAMTARELDDAGWRWRSLRTVWDVDRPADLERIRTLPLPFRLPRFSSGPRRRFRG